MSSGQDGAAASALARLARSRTRLALDLAGRGQGRSLSGKPDLTGAAVLAVPALQWALRRHPAALLIGAIGLGALVLLTRQRHVERGVAGAAAPPASDLHSLAAPWLSLALTALAAATRP